MENFGGNDNERGDNFQALKKLSYIDIGMLLHQPICPTQRYIDVVDALAQANFSQQAKLRLPEFCFY